MKLKINHLTVGGQAQSKISPEDILNTRRHVISGDWTAINKCTCTLTDLGLRHNGSGLVWLGSGVSVHQADHDAGVSGKDKTSGSVNGLPWDLVCQWTEYTTRLSFAVSIPAEVRRQFYQNDAEFGVAMRKAGYVPVRTRKLTGKKDSFWLYRITGNDKGVCPEEPAEHKASHVFVQTSNKPRKAFKRLVVDGKWLYVYDDHVRFLTKKRHRIDGVRVQGFTAKGLRVEVVA